MTIDRSWWLALIAIWVIAAAHPAVAQSVDAESLFREGKRLMKEGKLAEACDKLEASDRLEPSVGTLLNLADCREQNHQLATAWATFLKASSAAKQAGNDPRREAEARRRAHALEPRLAYLTVSVADASRVEGLAITRNGTVIDPALWNQGIPVDPGEYEIVGQAPGLEPWATRTTITAEGQKVSVEVPRFKRLEELQPAVTPARGAQADAGRPPPGATRATPAGVDEPSRYTGTRKAAIGVAAGGGVSLAIGLVFAIKASDLAKQSDAICPSAACNDMHAVQLNTDARHKARIANIGFGVGGVAVAGAVALWFLGKPSHDEAIALTPAIGGDAVGVTLAGRF